MKRKLTMKTLLLYCISLLATQAYSQGWMKKYSPDLEMGPSSFYTTADGNFITTGWNLSGTRLRIMKISANGEPMWQTDNDSLHAISFSNITQDGGFVYIGTAMSGVGKLVTRTDANGQRLWIKDVNPNEGVGGNGNADIDTTTDGGFYATFSLYDTIRRTVVVKLGGNGDSIWRYEYLDSVPEKYPHSIRTTKDGGFLLTVVKGNSTNITYVVIKADANGSVLWQYQLPFQTYATPTITDGPHIFLCTGSILHTGQNGIVKLDENGNELWNRTYPVLPDSSMWYGSIIEKEDGNLALLGGRNTNNIDKFSFSIVDTLGNVLHYKKLPSGNLGYNLGLFRAGYKTFVRCTDGGYAMAGWITNDPQGYSAFIIKMDSMGNVYPSQLTGNTYADLNENCNKDSTEIFIRPVNITFSGINDTFTVITRDSGYYSLGLNNENYSISITPPSPYWQASNCNTANVNLPIGTTDSILLFGLKPIINSPFITINGEIDRQRACMPATYTAQYCNTGTAPFTGILILEIDTLLHVDSSSAQIITQSGNKYYFVVPQLDAMQCATLKVYCTVSCNPQYMGYTVCVDAHAEQDTVLMVPPGWDESNLQMFVAQTGTDTITFTLKNLGKGDMGSPKGLMVIEDNVIMINTPVLLPAGATYTVTVPANGSTWRATIPQTDFNPYSFFATAAIEGAGINQQGGISLGFYLQYPINGYYGYHYRACGEIRNSYDPNEKIVLPRGAGANHLVDSTTELEYTLYFQNTGNDTAYQIRITDTLESYLNPATLVLGASSHQYNAELIGNNLLQFTFVNINLPDSATNPQGSNGFVKFSIKQKAGNTQGTVINNKVAIYFDYNPPIVTNTATVRIGNILVADIKSVYTDKTVSINAYPNPFVNSTRIEVEGENFAQLQLHIYDQQGRLVKLQHAQNTNYFIIEKAGLANGTYYFQISSNGKPVGNGKLLAR